MKAILSMPLKPLKPDEYENEIGFLSQYDVDESLEAFLDLKSASFERYYVPKPHVVVYKAPFHSDFHDGFCRVLMFHDTLSGKRLAVQQFCNYATESFDLSPLPQVEVFVED